MGSTVFFNGGIWVGDVVGAGDVDIDEASDIHFVGVVSLSWTDIVLEMACLGYMRVHAASEYNTIK